MAENPENEGGLLPPSPGSMRYAGSFTHTSQGMPLGRNTMSRTRLTAPPFHQAPDSPSFSAGRSPRPSSPSFTSSPLSVSPEASAPPHAAALRSMGYYNPNAAVEGTASHIAQQLGAIHTVLGDQGGGSQGGGGSMGGLGNLMGSGGGAGGEAGAEAGEAAGGAAEAGEAAAGAGEAAAAGAGEAAAAGGEAIGEIAALALL